MVKLQHDCVIQTLWAPQYDILWLDWLPFPKMLDTTHFWLLASAKELMKSGWSVHVCVCAYVCVAVCKSAHCVGTELFVCLCECVCDTCLGLP